MGEEKKEEAPVEVVEAKPEEKKEEKTEDKKAEEKKEEEATPPPPPPPPPPPFVLFVDLHCVGCAKKIERSLMKIRGVEEVKTDMDKNQVTIKGIVEPEAVCKRIMKKTKRSAKVLSPLPAAEGEPMPQVVTSQVSGLTSVELNVNMHCEACAEQLKRKILKMRGVQTVETELSASKVMVMGTMDANSLVNYVYRRTKKQARIVPQPEPEPEKPPEKKEEEEKPAEEAKPEENAAEKKEEEAKPAEEEGGGESNKEEAKNEGEGEGNNTTSISEEEHLKKMMYYYQPLYVIERIPPPQLFSDENPNACCIS